MTKPIRLLLVDDQALIREGLRTLLTSNGGIAVIGQASSGEDGVRLAESTRPDVILMDLRMPGIGGIEATRRIRIAAPDSRVLVLTTFDDDELVYGALRAGAVGFLLKDAAEGELVAAIRATARGESALPPGVAAKVVREFVRLEPSASAAHDHGLSNREVDVLRLVAAGASNKEIAARLPLAVGTVKNYVTTILRKLEVRDRTQAALKARELGILGGTDRKV